MVCVGPLYFEFGKDSARISIAWIACMLVTRKLITLCNSTEYFKVGLPAPVQYYKQLEEIGLHFAGAGSICLPKGIRSSA